MNLVMIFNNCICNFSTKCKHHIIRIFCSQQGTVGKQNNICVAYGLSPALGDLLILGHLKPFL